VKRTINSLLIHGSIIKFLPENQNFAFFRLNFREKLPKLLTLGARCLKIKNFEFLTRNGNFENFLVENPHFLTFDLWLITRKNANFRPKKFRSRQYPIFKSNLFEGSGLNFRKKNPCSQKIYFSHRIIAIILVSDKSLKILFLKTQGHRRFDLCFIRLSGQISSISVNRKKSGFWSPIYRRIPRYW